MGKKGGRRGESKGSRREGKREREREGGKEERRDSRGIPGSSRRYPKSSHSLLVFSRHSYI